MQRGIKENIDMREFKNCDWHINNTGLLEVIIYKYLFFGSISIHSCSNPSFMLMNNLFRVNSRKRFQAKSIYIFTQSVLWKSEKLCYIYKYVHRSINYCIHIQRNTLKYYLFWYQVFRIITIFQRFFQCIFFQ